MSWFKQMIKHEFDADMFACLYAACILWLLSLFRTLCGGAGISFGEITCCIILSWALAWVQKLLFWKERVLPRSERVFRSILWNLIPIAAFVLTAYLSGWFAGCPGWTLFAFGGAVAATFLSWWGCIQLFCRDETEEWNTLLTQFKQNSSSNKEDSHD